jgi:ureidoglycolate lyase
MTVLNIEALTPEAFAPFGRVLGKPATPTEAPGRLDLDVWFNISDLMGLETQNPTFTFLTVKRHDAPLNQIERHCRTAEFFIPLQGESAIMVAPMSNPDDPDAVPDQAQIRAFRLDGSAGIAFPRGGWHWAPVPLGESATFLLIFDRDILSDIQIREIEVRQLILPS